MEAIMRSATRIAIAAVVIVLTPFLVGNLFENLDAHEVMVIQSPVSGDLTVHTDPGIKYQGFGKVTKYPRRAQYAFVNDGKVDNSKKLRFNDGGHANLSGAVSWEMPLTPEKIISIHKTFGNTEGVESAAVAKMIDAAVYLAGPLMSSTESSGERRAELVQFINDQAEHGVYVTQVKEKEVTDPMNDKNKKLITVTEIMRDEKGMPKRQQGSILQEFGIKLLPMSIQELKYDAIVEKQIAERQNATTQVQIAQANAKRAEQDAITIEKQGQAAAAKTKWEQETVKAKEVTLAQQKLEVATLAAKEAEAFKREQILRGEGEAARKQLVMNADGALDQKLEAYKDVQKQWAEAFAKYQGQMVPGVVMGGGNGSQTSMGNAQNFVDLMTMKAAKDLGLDMTVTGKTATNKK